jgi:hypothetical protein
MHKPVLTIAILLLAALSYAQESAPTPPAPNADNSFLIEEAYNQEPGVVQHISVFNRFFDSREWGYSFTQEWPVVSQAHQFSYTLPVLVPGAESGIGDVALNYRYQLIANDALAVAPRVSLLLPTGSVEEGTGSGGTGFQFNLPVSITHGERLVTHWNAGFTSIFDAESSLGRNADINSFHLGQSFVWLAHPKFNALLETVYSQGESVSATGGTDSESSIFVSPGIRWAHDFDSGLQIVPGIGVPIGLGRESGEMGIILYLSFEHPFGAGDK